MHRMSKKPRGFTLVELLVVIGIIALLISILMPALSRARDAANTIACGSNLRQIGQAMQLYANANKFYLPLHEAGEIAGVKQNIGRRWTHTLMASELLPGRPDPNDTAAVPYTFIDTSNVFRCPADATVNGTNITVDQLNVSYVPNHALMPNIPSKTTKGPFKVTDYRNASERLWITEKWAARAMNQSLGLIHDVAKTRERTWAPHSGGGEKGRMNVLFLDGHVEAMPRTEVMAPVDLKIAADPDPDPRNLWGTAYPD